MRIITVEREYGSGGARVAEKLARRLNWKLWDTQLTQEIARRAHIRPEAAARHDERVDPLLYRLFKVFASGNSVIVGRGSPYILRNRPDVFHIFVFAPLEEKIRRVRTLGKSETEARELVETIDKERAQFIKRYFGADWPCRQLYDLMINSDRGDEYVIETILNGVALAEKTGAAVAAAQ